MSDFFSNTLTQSNWFLPLLVSIIVLPILMMLFNEFIFRARKKEKRLVPPVKMLRNIILPLIAIFVVVTQLTDISRDAIFVKVLETLLYILVLNALLAIINVLFFSKGPNSMVKTDVPQLFLDIFRVFLVILGTAITLSAVWGMDLGNMVTALGVGSFVLGLALQDTLGNLFAGIALIYEKPFGVGDIISVDDERGQVVEMNWRTVRLVNSDSVLIVIPHLVLGSSIVHNLSAPNQLYLLTNTIGFSADLEPNKVKKALKNTLLSISDVLLDPPPVVYTTEYADNCINYSVEFYIEDFALQSDIMDEFMTKVWYVADRKKLDMPYPHLNVLLPKEERRQQQEADEVVQKELKELLGIIPLKEEQLAQLEKGTQFLRFGAGEFIVKQGDFAGTVYILKSGKVKLTFEQDQHKQIRYLYAEDFFGEVTMLSDKLCAFSVEVIEDVALLAIAQAQVIEMVSNNPKLIYYLDNNADRSDKGRIAKMG